MMDWIYTAISWILLRWHSLWDSILPGSAYFLGTNWDWILAIVFLVITVRIILFPIFVKQIRSQRAMQALQPKMKELQAKYKGDQQTLRQEMMKLYQEEKVNPLMGCLPMFLQIPVFLGLFHVLRRLNPDRTDPKTELYTWTYEQFHEASIAELFTSPIASTFATGNATTKAVAGVLVVIMMVTTFLTSRQMILKTGWAADPQQRMIQKLMLYGIPVSLLLSGWYFPIGVIIYWVTQNLFSLGQQHWVLHKYPPPVMEGATPIGGRRKTEEEAPKSAIQRFFSPTMKPPAPKPSGATPGKSGFFRRKPVEMPADLPRLDASALAPKPGAKPVRAKPSGEQARGQTAKTPESGTSAAADKAPSATQPAAAQGSAKQAGTKQPAGKQGTGKQGGGGSGQRKRSTSAKKRTANKKGGAKR